MNSDDLRRFGEVGTTATFPAGHVVIERGQYGGGLFVILEGTVVVEAPEGNLEYGSGSVVGERALLSPTSTRAARVRATSDLRVLAVDRFEFERLCAEDEGLAQRVATFAAGTAQGEQTAAVTRDFGARH